MLRLVDHQNRPDIPSSVPRSLVEVSRIEPFTALAPSPHDAAFNYAEWHTQQLRDSLEFIYGSPMSTTNSRFPPPNLSSLQSLPISVYIDTYFCFFHHTHPILLPRREFEQRLSKGLVPYHLQCAVKFNSTFFISSVVTGSCGDTLDNMFNEHTPRDAYTVQAMLLFGIGMHANNLLQESINFLRMAGDLARELGMHRKAFATDHGEGDPVLEESWRRTWWELYALDGILAGVCPAHHFDLYDVESDVPLPCEESNYNSRVC